MSDEIPEGYAKGAELTFAIVAAWKHVDGPPVFRFPPRDYALLADLRDVGHRLAVNGSARDLVADLNREVVARTGNAPTTMMLRVVLELLGHTIEWVPLEQLELGQVRSISRGLIEA